jgi:PhnB protein
MALMSTHVAYNGNCEEAFNFYKSVFGGEFSVLMRNANIPDGIPIPPGTEGDKILHISLPISKESALMGCDMPGAYGPAVRGNSFNISINTESEDEATRIFNGLVSGGKVVMPQEKTFWGAYFGMLTDKFGVQWMISYEYSRQ